MRRLVPDRRIGALLLLAALVACDTSTPDLDATSTTALTTATSVTTSDRDISEVVAAIADAATCTELAALIVEGLQFHIDAYAQAAPEQLAQYSADLRPDLQRLATGAGSAAERLGCSGPSYVDLLTAQLETLRLGTGVQRAVAGTFVSGLLGGDDPSDPGPAVIDVATAGELEAAVLAAGTGSTIRLAGGDYVLETPLVVLRGITLVGAGEQNTTIRSTAPGAAVVAGTNDTVTISALAVENATTAASVVAVTRGGLTIREVTLRGGRRDAAGNGGYGLILAPDTALGVGDLVVADSTFVDNDGGGILIDGPITPTLNGIVVVATTGCAVCWDGASGGTLDDLTVTGGEVGLRVEGSASPEIRSTDASDVAVGVVVGGAARPTLTDATITDAEIGVAVVEDAAPEFTLLSVIDAVDVGLRLAGTSTATVTDLAITGATTGGIVVIEEAAPTIDGATVDVTGDVGVLHGGSSTGTVDGLTVSGSRLGIQISEDAAPMLRRIVVTAVSEAAALVLERGGGSIESMQCDPGNTGVIGLQTEGTILIAEDVGCRIVEGA